MHVAPFFHALLFCIPLLSLDPRSADAYENDAKGYIVPSEFSAPTPPILEGTHAATAESIRLDGLRFEKFQKALKILKVPAEQDPDFSDFPDEKSVSQSEVMDHLRWIDPHSALRRYLDFQTTTLAMFRDFFSNILPKSYLDYSVRLNTESQYTSNDSEDLIERLQRISNQVKDPESEAPLEGFRVIIDPGHMGAQKWDEITGKFVTYKGMRVSEGEINLLTSFLLAKQLEDLGATVKLTRTSLTAVSRQTYENFDRTPFIYQYFYNSLDSWMSKYLHLSDAELATELPKAAEVKVAYGEEKHHDLYVQGEDLDARSRMIDAFHPDMILDIHYDAVNNTAVQSLHNEIEAFVPGGFLPAETGSRQMRSLALKHLVEIRRWNASIAMAASVTSAMSESLKLPLLSTPQIEDAVRVKEGVYARNLYITRRAREGLMVYLECLHYDHVSEYKNMATKNARGTYHSLSFQYPARLAAVATGIRTGILNYFMQLNDAIRLPEEDGEN